MSKTKMSSGRIVLTALIYMIIAQIIHSISAMLTMSFYKMKEYFPVWSKIMMPTTGPPPMSFILYSLFYGLVIGILFAVVYNIIKNSVPADSTAGKGLLYGLLVFAIAGIPMALTFHLLIYLPGLLIIIWAIESLIIYLIMGMITSALNK